MRLIFSIIALTILLVPVSASAHGNVTGKNECHRHANDKDGQYHCH